MLMLTSCFFASPDSHTYALFHLIQRPPRNESDLKSTLDDMKEVRLARREARLKREQQGGTSVSGTEAASSTTSASASADRISSVASSVWSPSLWLPRRDRDVDGWRRADKERMV